MTAPTSRPSGSKRASAEQPRMRRRAPPTCRSSSTATASTWSERLDFEGLQDGAGPCAAGSAFARKPLQGVARLLKVRDLLIERFHSCAGKFASAGTVLA